MRRLLTIGGEIFVASPTIFAGRIGRLYEGMQQPQVGVTEEPPAEPAEPTKVLTKEELVERFRKMAIGVSNGPLPSGDGAAVESLTLGDLKLVFLSVCRSVGLLSVCRLICG